MFYHSTMGLAVPGSTARRSGFNSIINEKFKIKKRGGVVSEVMLFAAGMVCGVVLALFVVWFAGICEAAAAKEKEDR